MSNKDENFNIKKAGSLAPGFRSNNEFDKINLSLNKSSFLIFNFLKRIFLLVFCEFYY